MHQNGEQGSNICCKCLFIFDFKNRTISQKERKLTGFGFSSGKLEVETAINLGPKRYSFIYF